MPDADPRCPTCPFWDEGARRRKAESAEHHDWRPCTHPKPDAIMGPQELLTRTSKLLTSPATTCRSHPARSRA